MPNFHRIANGRGLLSGSVGIVAGLILIISGVVAISFMGTILTYFLKHYGTNLSPDETYGLKVVISILAFLVGLGGLLVIFGGSMFLLKHRISGRVLIGLGGGMAVVGLIVTMVVAFAGSGFSSPIFRISYFTVYWLGAILAIIAMGISIRA